LVVEPYIPSHGKSAHYIGQVAEPKVESICVRRIGGPYNFSSYSKRCL